MKLRILLCLVLSGTQFSFASQCSQLYLGPWGMPASVRDVRFHESNFMWRELYSPGGLLYHPSIWAQYVFQTLPKADYREYYDSTSLLVVRTSTDEAHILEIVVGGEKKFLLLAETSIPADLKLSDSMLQDSWLRLARKVISVEGAVHRQSFSRAYRRFPYESEEDAMGNRQPHSQKFIFSGWNYYNNPNRGIARGGLVRSMDPDFFDKIKTGITAEEFESFWSQDAIRRRWAERITKPAESRIAQKVYQSYIIGNQQVLPGVVRRVYDLFENFEAVIEFATNLTFRASRKVLELYPQGKSVLSMWQLDGRASWLAILDWLRELEFEVPFQMNDRLTSKEFLEIFRSYRTFTEYSAIESGHGVYSHLLQALFIRSQLGKEVFDEFFSLQNSYLPDRAPKYHDVALARYLPRHTCFLDETLGLDAVLGIIY